MTLSTITNTRKTYGSCIFIRNVYSVDHMYRITEEIIYEGDKRSFLEYNIMTYGYCYLPEINYNSNKNCFTICCYSHGNMTPDEFEKFIKAQQQGLAVASFLTQTFCTNHTKEDDSHETH